MKLDKFIQNDSVRVELTTNTADFHATLVSHDEHGVVLDRGQEETLWYVPWTSIEQLIFTRRPASGPREATIL